MEGRKARLAVHYADVVMLQEELKEKAKRARRRYSEKTKKPLRDVDLHVYIPNSAYVRPRLTDSPSFEVKYFALSYPDVLRAVGNYKIAVLFNLCFREITVNGKKEVIADEMGKRMRERVEKFVATKKVHPPDIPALSVEPSPLLLEAEKTTEQLKEHIFWLTTWEEYLHFQTEALNVGPDEGMILPFQAPKFVGFYMIEWSTKHIATAREFIDGLKRIRQQFEKDLEFQEPSALFEIRHAVQEYRKQNYIYDEENNLMGLPQPKLFLERLRNLPDILMLIGNPEDRNFT